MNEMKVDDGADRALAAVRDLDGRAEKLRTPCGDGQMVWRRWGGGARTAVFMHGAHGSWTHWIRNIPALAERYTVLVPDLPGMGDSDVPPMPATGESLGDILAEGLRRILPADAPPIHLGGFSFGASLACLLAARQPERAASLTLIGCGGLRSSPPVRAPMMSWRRLTDEAEIMAAHRHNVGAMLIADPAAVDELSVLLQHENARRTRLDNRPIAKEGVTLKALPQVRSPVFAIWGEEDLGRGERRAKIESFMRGARPDMPVEEIAGAGHWVQYEAAGRVNELLLAFLSAHDG